MANRARTWRDVKKTVREAKEKAVEREDAAAIRKADIELAFLERLDPEHKED